MSLESIEALKRLEVKKGDFLQRKGELGSKVYFVESGLLRSYTIDENGKENIFMFAPEGWTIGDYNGPEVPTELYIDALENTVVRALAKDIEREKENVGAIIKRMAVLQKRIVMLLSTNVMERFEHFVHTYPDIAQRVPQKMIASYIGVTPETLSAAKRKSTK